jgi:outer membrane protein OmpA-like peptidoglycan-associated protein
MSIKLLFIFALIAISPSIAAATQNDTLFSPPKEVSKTKTETRNFIAYDIITQISKANIDSKVVKGQLSRINYQLPVSLSPENLINNYKQQINALNGQVIFECHTPSCFDQDDLARFISPLDTTPKDEPSLITAKIQLAQKQLYVSVYAMNWKRAAHVQLDIIEVIEEPLDLLNINQAYLGTDIIQKKFADLSHKDQKNTKDHPMLTRIPGAYIDEYQQVEFGETSLVTGILDKQHQVKTYQGRITDIGYTLPRGYSEFEVDANYQNALKQLGFIEQYSCLAKACGKTSQLYHHMKLLKSNGMDDSQRYRLYQLQRPQGNVQVMTFVIGYNNGLSAEIRIIEQTDLNDKRVAIDLEGLTNKLAETGHVALEGLIFKFDSDELEAETIDVIKVVAQYLQSHPKQQFYVIGHTDDQGSQAYNYTLSEKRAAAVKSILQQQFSIPVSQLEAKGIGEYAPVANNLNEAGRHKNRRVELVLRSDVK